MPWHVVLDLINARSIGFDPMAALLCIVWKEELHARQSVHAIAMP